MQRKKCPTINESASKHYIEYSRKTNTYHDVSCRNCTRISGFVCAKRTNSKINDFFLSLYVESSVHSNLIRHKFSSKLYRSKYINTFIHTQTHALTLPLMSLANATSHMNLNTHPGHSHTLLRSAINNTNELILRDLKKIINRISTGESIQSITHI